MPDYQLGKIYKIVDNTNNNVYIGSTCKSLKRRLSGHVGDYKKFIKGNRENTTSFDIIKNDDYDIILIDNYSCDYKDELLARERYWCKKIKCVNKNKPGLFNELGQVEYKKQYYVEHRDHLKEKVKQYYNDHEQYYVEHRENINKYHKQYYNEHKDRLNEKQYCVCGGSYNLTNKSKHMKTSKHIEYVKSETIKQYLINNLSFDETYQMYKTVKFY